ncbi:MAG: MFS transporter [Paracoccus sp. (in: a-proteobacteria)]|uniref:MFS transporter n=1 Tax=Paracoccus sp. TaxID=267 RepID=UPI0026DFCB82|nr:MFS transporter [Paracoccus sp. (in: a-proteobacteria)]MDO5621363.1 MFS transporter [Paracoccus sp. (in: a-proteobacteria)]
MIAETPENLARARRNVLVLGIAQAILGAQMSIMFISAGLIGQSLTPWLCIATLPVSAIILGNVISARPLANFMARRGRQAGFSLATLTGAIGAALCVWAMWIGSFWLFTGASLLMGVYMAGQGFYRFAATDAAPASFAPKAISWVMAAGLVAALTGPGIVRLTSSLTPIPFMGSYMVVIGLNLLGPLLFSFLDAPRPAAGTAPARRLPLGELLARPQIAVAMIVGMVSYALMNLVMTSTPLAVIGCGYTTSDVSDIISLHIVAMFLPSFFTGHLIARFGATPIVTLGLFILAGSAAVALSGVELTHFFGALILLGLGWNFGYIGATAMLTQAHKPEERAQVQGLNDTILFTGVFIASLASGGLMNCYGGNAQTGWSAVNLAMVPFLILAGGALIWLVLRPKDDA